MGRTDAKAHPIKFQTSYESKPVCERDGHNSTAPAEIMPPSASLLLGADLYGQMSTTISPTIGSDPRRPVNLLSLGRNVLVVTANGMLTSSLDGGGPQGISQLLILNDVMEKLSKDESGDFEGIVKRPCDVFDLIGGVGTGGCVWFTQLFDSKRAYYRVDWSLSFWWY
jgi:hypothetical protein